MSIEGEENRPRQEQGRNSSGYLDSAILGWLEFKNSHVPIIVFQNRYVHLLQEEKRLDQMTAKCDMLR